MTRGDYVYYNKIKEHVKRCVDGETFFARRVFLHEG